MEGSGAGTMTVNTNTASALVNVAAVPWLASFTVGHDLIDEEHRRLIELFNEFCAMAAAKPGLVRLRHTARALIATLEDHFSSEEALFPLIGYRYCLSHVREHLVVGNSLTSLLLTDTGMEPAVAAATARMVVVEHILRHDLAFKTWVQHAAGH